MAPIHLHPTAPLAPRVLLPGDPGRALALAQSLLHEPKMFNHNRGLWGYTGAGADGEPLTVQSTGMGGPSAAIVMEELCDLGVQQAIRVGTCGALAAGLGLGELVVATEVLGADGASRALGAPERQEPDPELTARLRERAEHAGLVVTADLFYDPDTSRMAGWVAAGALAVEMEAAALLAVGARRGVPVAVLLAVSDSQAGGGERVNAPGYEEIGVHLGEVAAAALSGTG